MPLVVVALREVCSSRSSRSTNSSFSETKRVTFNSFNRIPNSLAHSQNVATVIRSDDDNPKFQRVPVDFYIFGSIFRLKPKRLNAVWICLSPNRVLKNLRQNVL